MGPEQGFTPPEIGLNAMEEESKRNQEQIVKTQAEIDAKKTELNEVDNMARSLEEEDAQEKPYTVVDKRVSSQENSDLNLNGSMADNSTVKDMQISPKDEAERGLSSEITSSSETNNNTETKTSFEARVDLVFNRKAQIAEELTALKSELQNLESDQAGVSDSLVELRAQEQVLLLQKSEAEKSVNSIKMSYLGKIGAISRQINALENQKVAAHQSVESSDDFDRVISTLDSLNQKIEALKQTRETSRSEYAANIAGEGNPNLKDLNLQIEGYEKNLQALRDGRASENYTAVLEEANLMVVPTPESGEISVEQAAVRGEEVTALTVIHNNETRAQEENHRGKLGGFLEKMRVKFSQNARKIATSVAVVGALAALLLGGNKLIKDSYTNIPQGSKLTSASIDKGSPSIDVGVNQNSSISEQISSPWSPAPHIEDQDNSHQDNSQESLSKNMYNNSVISQPDTPWSSNPDAQVTEGSDTIQPKINEVNQAKESGNQIPSHYTNSDIPVKTNSIEHAQAQVEHDDSDTNYIYERAAQRNISREKVDQLLGNPSIKQDLENRRASFGADHDKNNSQTFNDGFTDNLRSATDEWLTSHASGEASRM